MSTLGRHTVLSQDDRTASGVDISGAGVTLHDAFTLAADEDVLHVIFIGSTGRPLAGDGIITIQWFVNGYAMPADDIANAQTKRRLECLPIKGLESGDDVELVVSSTDSNAASVDVDSYILRDH